MQDLTFVVGEDRAVAELWEALGEAGLQMQASCTFPRLEGRIGLETTQEFFPDFEIDTGGLVRVHSSNVRGFARMPISFRPPA